MAAVLARFVGLSSLGILRPTGTSLVTGRFICSSSETDAAGPKIYTRTGDKGFSSTYGGKRLPKTHDIFEALGTTDELSSQIGVAREFCEEAGHGNLIKKLEEIQCILQEVGSNIATPRETSREDKLKRTEFSENHVPELEKWIDGYHNELPALTNFILPSGGKNSALLHIARTICRRAERRVVPLVQDGTVDPQVGRYLNRLSDFLFTAARYVAKADDREEKIYHRVDR